MRVLFSSTSGRGHVFPMLPLARALDVAGHEVLWATGAEAATWVAGAGIRTADAGLAGAELAERRAPVLAHAEGIEPVRRAAYIYPHMFAATLAPPMLDDLLPLAKRWAPDLMVHEHGELAAPLVGALCSVPSLTHAFGGGVPTDILGDAGALLAPLWAQHGLDVPPYAGCFESAYVDICPPSVQAVSLAHVTDVVPLRPVADTGGPPGAAGAAPAPDAGPDPLVYVTLGTVQARPGLLAAAIEGIAPLPVSVLVAVGPQHDPDALGRQPRNVRIERWVDQPAVLARCSVVVSHAGSGTFLGALAHGVPQLCLPQAADQFRNAEGGLRAGAALVLHPHEASPAAVGSAVHRLLTEPGLREASGRVADEIAAMPPPAAVAAGLADRFG